VLPDSTGDAPTISAALDSARAEDTVELTDGTYFEANLELRSHVLLKGTGAGQSIIDASREGHVLQLIVPDEQIAQAFVSDVTIRGGFAEYGGGVYVNVGRGGFGTLFIENSIVEQNEATVYGGGVYCANAGLDIRDSLVRDNIAGERGGGIAADAASSVIFSPGFPEEHGPRRLERNEADFGGGVWCGNVSLVRLENVVVARNRGRVDGGAIYQGGINAGCRVSGSTIVGNTSPNASVWWVSDRFEFSSLGGSLVAFNHGSSTFVSASPRWWISGVCNGLFGNEGDVGQFNGDVIIEEDPLFCDFDQGDFTLREDSPYLKKNLPPGIDCPRTFGAFKEPGCPISAVSRTTWGAIKARYGR
jgi:hypothetical protein